MTKPRILVVDDEESMRYFLRRSLKREGFNVETAASGEEALDLAGEGRFDLVLLDLRLPGRDGIEVLTELEAIAPETLVILMSGFGTVDRALAAMRKGAADFVAKPFKTSDIVVKIREALRKSGRAPAPVRAEPAPVERPPGQSVAAPPRPLSAYLIETAQALGVPLPDAESGDLGLKDALRIAEVLYLTELFRRTGGNVSMAARIAGISRPSMHRKIHDLEIDMESFRT